MLAHEINFLLMGRTTEELLSGLHVLVLRFFCPIRFIEPLIRVLLAGPGDFW